MKKCLQKNKGFVLLLSSGIPETNLNQASDLKEFGSLLPHDLLYHGFIVFMTV